jgi:Flp pilus assembly pilin Flp
LSFRQLKEIEMKLTGLQKFLHDDRGAITVDWVVLTAAIVAVAIAMVSIISAGVMTAASEIVFTMTN